MIHRFAFPTTIHFGAGARALVAEHLKAQGIKRPLIVTDRGIAPLPMLKAFIADLPGLDVGVFSDIWGNPVRSQVDQGVAAYKAHRADAVIGLGGGAALDVAKAVALMAVREPLNIAARSDMMMSSMMGAIAFQKDLGAVHSCAHALSTVADLHHGLANGIMIDHVMRFNMPSAIAKMAELSHVVGAAVSGALPEASAEGFIDWLATLKADLAIPATLSAYRGKRPVTT